MHAVSDTISQRARHFTKICKSVHPWDRVSEIQSIKDTKKISGHCQDHYSVVYKQCNMFTQQMFSTALHHHFQQIENSLLRCYLLVQGTATFCSRIWVPLGIIQINPQSQKYQNCKMCCPPDSVLSPYPFAGCVCWNSIVCGLKQSKMANQPERFCIFGCMCGSWWRCASFA